MVLWYKTCVTHTGKNPGLLQDTRSEKIHGRAQSRWERSEMVENAHALVMELISTFLFPKLKYLKSVIINKTNMTLLKYFRIDEGLFSHLS
jgi:hypothetical protein